MVPIVGSSIISGGANLLGNIFGNSNQSKINQMNLDYGREMLEKQMDYNTTMWNKQNEYNSPVEQVKRLKQAGINPYVGLGLLNSGTAQSAGGVNTPSANAQAFRPDFSGVANAVQTYAAQKMQKEVNQSVINQNDSIAQLNNEQSKYYGIKALAEIQEKMSNAENSTQKAIWQSIMNGYGDQIFSSDIAYKQRQTQLLEEQTRGQLVQNALDSVHLIHLPKKYQLEFSSIAASTALAVASGKLTMAKATSEMLGWLETIERNERIKLDNKLFNATFDDMVKKARQDAQGTYQTRLLEMVDPIADALHSFDGKVNNWIHDNITKPSKRAWKDTKRSFSGAFNGFK